jgi:hypothetical protein
MVPVDLALALRDAGLRWTPAPGDRFVLPHKGMDDEVFVISDMTVEVHRFPTGPVIGFNGVTEWALDSIRQDEALWIPVEHQLRERLGDRFAKLEADPPHGFTVTVLVDDGVVARRAPEAAEAYGLALLDVLALPSSRDHG